MTTDPQVGGKATVIRNIAWLVAYDAEADAQTYAQDAEIAFIGDRFVDPATLSKDQIGEVIDGSEMLIVPGFIDVHAHPGFETMIKGLTEEVGSPQFYMSSLYEYLYLFDTTEAGMRASTKVALSELMQSGVTTIVDISTPHEGWVDVLAQSGMRAYAAPMFRDGKWFTDNGREVKYSWDTQAGAARMAAALEPVDAAINHASGRLGGMVVPAQIDTVSPDLFIAAGEEARKRGITIQTHASQSVVDFTEIQRRHGKTPVGWLESLGLLGPDMIIGHGIFLDHNDWLGWPERRDLGLLAETGTHVAHCPTVFMRRGITMQDVGSYMRAGINIGIGTDTYPHNFIEEMRNGIYAARIAKRDVRTIAARDMINAATLGGAKMLGRTDIGRIAPGAKADFFIVDLKHPSMRPVYDPIRSLVYSSGERAVRETWVDGQRIVKDGKCLTFNVEEAIDEVEAAQRASVTQIQKWDWNGRPAEVLMPKSY